MKDKIQTMINLQIELQKLIGFDEEKNRIALISEVGEILNEFQKTFKYWKKSAKNNRKKGIIELADAWHILLSLHLNKKDLVNDIILAYNMSVRTYKPLSRSLIGLAAGNLEDFFRILFDFGFSFEELFNGYVQKNQINRRRYVQNY